VTEAEWLACEDPLQILRADCCLLSFRKVKLFALASHRHMCEDGKHPWLVNGGLERWVEGAEEVEGEDLRSLCTHYVLSSTLERPKQAELLRDIFRYPFRRVGYSRAWHTDTVLSLARRMYESRDFSAMPILADALQDAGCEDPDILNHCRGPGSHVRGCWVIDRVLGNQ
jgi:hypothetical protein